MKSKGKRSKKKIVLISFIVVLVLLIGTIAIGYNYVNKIKTVPLKATEEELNVSEEAAKKSEEQKITNILLLGIDEDENASDAMMILSLNETTGSVKLTSVMRDTYVYQGEGMANKLNYEYHYGGVERTIATFNSLFNLDITKYAKVDFNGFANIVDTFGGYEVDITESQRNQINEKIGYNSLKKSGHVYLTGEQTQAYARIRLDDSDFQRTSRQRDIMFDIFKKLKNQPITSYPSIVSNLTSYVETNLSTMECLDLGNALLSISDGSAEEFRIPMDGTTSEYTEGVYHLNWDEEVNIKALDEFIYGSNQ